MERVKISSSKRWPISVALTSLTRSSTVFLTGRSTTTNLLETLNDWTIALQDKKSVTAAYIDFSKAFEMVTAIPSY
jgi:hypothetical protein